MSLPKYLNKDESNKERSQKQEKRVQRQMNSGAHWTQKGDLKDDECLYESKLGKKQVTVTMEMLAKIHNEAWMIGKHPILIVELGDLANQGYIIKAEVFKKG